MAGRAVQRGCFCCELKHSQKTCVKTPQEECTARSAGTHFSSKTFSVQKGIPPINRFVSGNTVIIIIRVNHHQQLFTYLTKPASVNHSHLSLAENCEIP